LSRLDGKPMQRDDVKKVETQRMLAEME